MTNHQILYLSQADVTKVNLDMATVIKLLETAFGEKGAGKVEMPPKPGIHPTGRIYPCHASIHPVLRSAGIKWVSGYPENQRPGTALYHRAAHSERCGDRASHTL